MAPVETLPHQLSDAAMYPSVQMLNPFLMRICDRNVTSHNQKVASHDQNMTHHLIGI